MLDPALRATLEQRVREMENARTVQASPTATIKPAASMHPPDPKRLPRISIGGAGTTGAAATPSTDLELRALLGEGGMGRVHAAYQHSLSREVAIKVLREASASAAMALLREAVITGTLEHPGVVPVHALGVDGHGSPVLVMKRIEGVQWADLIRDPDHAAWEKRAGDRTTAHVEILMQVCQTVQFAHTRGILHRDIKPENVMLGDFGEVYVVDWGIALRLSGPATGDSALAGTPAYMAPEMVTGVGLDERTDVYLLGATLHEVLTGEVKNRGDTMQSVLAAALVSSPFPYDASVPSELAEICNRATARDPKDRFESADALRRALAAYLHHRGSIALAEGAAERCASLEAALAEAEAAPADLRRAYRLASEARFACTEALRTWPENARAREELERCQALVIDLELRQGHVDAAEALVRELEHPPGALLEKLMVARKKREEREAEQRRLEAIAHDADVNVGARPRTWLLVLLGGGALAVAGAVASGLSVTRPRMLGISVFFFTTALVVTVVFRKHLLANAFNRRATTMLLVAIGSLVLSRAVALAEDLNQSYLVVQDLIVMTALTAAGTVLLRWLWVMLPIQLLAIGLAVAVPRIAPNVLGFTLTLLAVALVLALQHERRST